MSKRLAPSFSYPTRLAKKVRRTTKLQQVMELVLPDLHWSDAIAVGATCKDFQQIYQSHSDKMLTPVVEQLEAMVRSNVCQMCDRDKTPSKKTTCTCLEEFGGDEGEDTKELMQLDPRFLEGYRHWSKHKKCGKMVEYISYLVDNMRSYMTPLFEDPSQLWSEANPFHWSMGDDYEIYDDWLKENPRRGALALNLAILSFAQSGMGGDYYFNEAFLGRANACLGGGSMYGIVVCSMLAAMFPLRDEDLINFFKSAVYPSLKKQELLGKVLMEKMWLSAPLFRFWVPAMLCRCYHWRR